MYRYKNQDFTLVKGTLVNNKLHGNNYLLEDLNTKDIIEGSFNDNNLVEGTIFYKSKGYIYGTFLNNLLHGTRYNIELPRIKFNGTFINGKFINGEIKYESGLYLSGTFILINKQYKLHGKDCLLIDKDNIQYDGEFINGDFINGYIIKNDEYIYKIINSKCFDIGKKCKFDL